MKIKLASGVALAFALIQFAAAPAYAEPAATQFRAPAAHSFSAGDLQAYGLDARATQRAVELQNQGYQIQVLTPEQARAYQAGMTNNEWIVLGIIAGAIIIAAAVN